MGEGSLSVGRSAGSFHHWVSPLPWQHLVFWADWFYIILLFSVKMVCQILNFIAMESFYVIDAYQLNYFAKPYVWLFCFIVNLLSHCRRGGWCWGHWQASRHWTYRLCVTWLVTGIAAWPGTRLLLLGAGDPVCFSMCALSWHILVLIYFRVKIYIIFSMLSLVALNKGFLHCSVLEKVLSGFQAILSPKWSSPLPPACKPQILCIRLTICFQRNHRLLVNWFMSPVNGPILRVAEKLTHQWNDAHRGVLKHTKSTWLLCVLRACLSTDWMCCEI